MGGGGDDVKRHLSVPILAKFVEFWTVPRWYFRLAQAEPQMGQNVFFSQMCMFFLTMIKMSVEKVRYLEANVNVSSYKDGSSDVISR